MDKHNKQMQTIDLSSAAETIESLDKRIKSIDEKIATIVDSLSVIMNMFDNISTEQQRLYYEVEYDMSALTNTVEYLKEVGDGEVY